MFYLLSSLINALRKRPWVLHCTMGALFVLTILLAFQAVLPLNVIFLAPDAPLEPHSFGEALKGLWKPAPALLNCFRLLPFEVGYEGSFIADLFIMCGAAMFLLRGYAVPWAAAWVGGFAAAFMGYFSTLFCAGHRGVVDALAITCFAFGFILRGIQRSQWRWFVGLGCLLPFGLAAQADIWFIVMLAVITYALYLFVLQCRTEKAVLSPIRQILPGIVLLTLCFFITGWPALRHTFGAAQETRATQLQAATAHTASTSAEKEARWQFTTDWSLPPEDCKDLIIRNAQGCTSYSFDPNPYRGRMGSASLTLRQHSIHFFWFNLLLALIAVCYKDSPTLKTHRFFWAALGIITLILAFGRYTPLYRLLWELPILQDIRAPIKWLHLTGFAVAILAGFGAAKLHAKLPFFAPLACLILALNGVATIRPFVFPIALPTATDFAALPRTTKVVAAPHFHALVRYYGLIPTDNPYEAQAGLLLRPARHGFKLELITANTHSL